MSIDTFETLSALGAIFLQIASLLILILFIARKTLFEKISKRVFLLFSIIILFSIIGSLAYSEYYEVSACKLCWFQRIFLFPQLITVIVTWFHKELRILIKHTLALSVPGFALALYQILWQFRAASSAGISCGFEDATSCSQIHMLKFGFVTFPVVSASVFLFLIVLSVLVSLNEKRKGTK